MSSKTSSGGAPKTPKEDAWTKNVKQAVLTVKTAANSSRTQRKVTEKQREANVNRSIQLLETELTAAHAVWLFSKDPQDLVIYIAIKKRFDQLNAEVGNKKLDDITSMFSTLGGTSNKKNPAKK